MASAATPTSPPPPFEPSLTPTSRPPEPTPTSRPGGGGGGDHATPTSYSGGGGVWATRTPTLTPTPSLDPAMLTGTPTPTPAPNLRVVVYVDTNNNHLREQGEGVEGLRIVAAAGTWTAEQWTHGGEAWFWLPADLEAGSEVQINTPYLHLSQVVRTPRENRLLQVDLRLDAPRYPIFLP
jgi:hypothetical protein